MTIQNVCASCGCPLIHVNIAAAAAAAALLRNVVSMHDYHPNCRGALLRMLLAERRVANNPPESRPRARALFPSAVRPCPARPRTHARTRVAVVYTLERARPASRAIYSRPASRDVLTHDSSALCTTEWEMVGGAEPTIPRGGFAGFAAYCSPRSTYGIYVRARPGKVTSPGTKSSISIDRLPTRGRLFYIPQPRPRVGGGVQTSNPCQAS